MHSLASLLTCLMLTTAVVHAEYRTLGTEITKVGKEKETLSIDIYSEAPGESQKGLGLAAAAKIVEAATGWGSGVGVAIIVNGVGLREYLDLVEAIAKNRQLDLVVVAPPGTKLGDQMLNHFKEKEKIRK